MSDIKSIPNELSPRLQQMLAAYRRTPERDPEAARRAQARFMAELDQMFVEAPAVTPAARSWLASARVGMGENLSRLFMRRSIVLLVALFVFGVCFLSGAGITAYAAVSALPGDPLYSLKTTLESVRADLSPDSAEQARLYMEFAGRRLVEMQSLIAKGRQEDIPYAASEFERDVQRSTRALDVLSGTNPAQAAALTTEFSPTLRSYSDILTHLLEISPGSAQPALQQALETCNQAEGKKGGDGDPTPTPAITPVVDTPTPIPTVATPVPPAMPGRNESNNNGNGTQNSGGSDDDDGGDDDGGDDDSNGDG